MLNHLDPYFKSIRTEIADLLQPGTERLLSIGCGSGETEKYLKDRYKISEITAIEKEESVATDLSSKVDRMTLGNVEVIEFPFSDEYFDAILALDVLEHLVNPEKVLDKCRRVLHRKGIFIASIPNVRHFEMILRMIAGDWFPRPQGILDYTHLHFYTNKSIKLLFQEGGFTIVQWRRCYRVEVYKSTHWILRKIQLGLARLSRLRLFFKLCNHIPVFREFITFQYIVVAKKT